MRVEQQTVGAVLLRWRDAIGLLSEALATVHGLVRVAEHGAAARICNATHITTSQK